MASITCYNQSAVRFRYPKPRSLSPCFRWIAFNMRTQGVSTWFVVSLSRKLHRNTRIPILAKKIRVPLLLPFFLRFNLPRLNLPSPRRPSFPRAERNFKPYARRSRPKLVYFAVFRAFVASWWIHSHGLGWCPLFATPRSLPLLST